MAKNSLTDLGLFNQRDRPYTCSTGIWPHSKTRRKALKKGEATIISGHLYYPREVRDA